MKPFKIFTKIIFFIPYYIIHKNIFFGYLFYLFIKRFKFKNLIFNIDFSKIGISNLSSFLFKTYELNDRILICRNINDKNHSIIIGGGLGFIAALCSKLSGNKILVFEINSNIINTLKNNLIINKVQFDLYNKNLLVEKNFRNNYFYETNNFLESSIYKNDGTKRSFQSINHELIKDFNVYNTLVIDAEGQEKYYIENIKKFSHIKHIFFELHYNLLSKNDINKIFENLEKNNFLFKDKSFNSFYYARDF